MSECDKKDMKKKQLKYSFCALGPPDILTASPREKIKKKTYFNNLLINHLSKESEYAQLNPKIFSAAIHINSKKSPPINIPLARHISVDLVPAGRLDLVE